MPFIMLHLFTYFVAPRGTCGPSHRTWNTPLASRRPTLNRNKSWSMRTYICIEMLSVFVFCLYRSIGLSSCSYFHGIPSIQALAFRSLKVSVSVSACLFASVSVSAHQLPFISLGMYSWGVLFHSWLLAGRRLCPRHFRHRWRRC